MSLDVWLTKRIPTRVYESNITHNLIPMAQAAGIYRLLWRPDELGITVAAELVASLTRGLQELKEDPDYFRQLNPESGWGNYEGLVRFVEEYLKACKQYPEAKVEVNR